MKSHAILFLLAAALAVSSAPGEEVIRLRGSDTLGAKLVPHLCEGYRKLRPGSEIAFDIAAEGSSTAFASLLAGTADIGMSSREIAPEEAARFAKQSITIEKRIVAHNVLVTIVNKENPVEGLTARQVEAIFTGETRNWSEWGGRDVPVVVFTRNTSSGSYNDFRHLAMGGRAYGESANKMMGGESPSSLVAQNAGGITYVSLAYSHAKGVRALKIDGIDPPSAVPSSYPYTRPCFFFFRGDASSAARAFLDWVTESPDARKIIANVGFLAPK